MIGIDYIGIIVLLIFLGLLIGFAAFGRRWPTVLRPLRGFDELSTAIERAVEAGERVHLSLGTGSVIGSDSAPALAGLAMLSRIATATTMSDKPVVVTAGDGAMALLAQDTLRAAYERARASERFQPTSGRMLGPTPFSYIASLPILIETEDVSVHLLAGSYGAEGALAADFGEHREAFVLAGTDDAQSQALLYVVAEYPLIGEEIFAGGAYLNVGPFHIASLRTQDMVRMVIVALILLGTILSTLGVSL
ncbi:MAG TPA: hypothetical protein G4O11_07415 [Anaerolineae bacterium]|nr:hypothetical protein [Anaerolineae bacterium]